MFFLVNEKKLPHPPLVFNDVNVTQSIYQMHLGIILESKLRFENQRTMITNKITRLLDSSINNKTFYQEPP